MSLSDAIASHGLGNPHIIPDGLIHRFQAPDDHSKNSWYVMYEDVGVFGCWKRGIQETWSNGKKLSGDEVRVAQKKMREHIRNSHIETAKLAKSMWSSARPDSHPYLTKKHIPVDSLRVLDGVLLVPMYADDEIVNLQRIYSDGSKRFLKGGRVKGCFSPIGSMTPPIAICEGYATGMAIHQKMGHSVAVAFNCHNLIEVAQIFRKEFGGKKLIICADNDWEKPENAGMDCARKAVELTQADLCYPEFEKTKNSEGKTDFWDYFYGA
jgi:putative DNA primase/helicase